jgi:hypothetical protein
VKTRDIKQPSGLCTTNRSWTICGNAKVSVSDAALFWVFPARRLGLKHPLRERPRQWRTCFRSLFSITKSHGFLGFPDPAVLKRPRSRRTRTKLVAARRQALCYSGSNVYAQPVRRTASARISWHRFDRSDLSRLIHSLLEQSARGGRLAASSRSAASRVRVKTQSPLRERPLRADSTGSRKCGHFPTVLRAVKFNPSRSSSKA